MAETHAEFMTFLNGEAAAMAPYRRVKLDGSNPGKILYADALDGDSWIGATLPMEGGAVAVGGRQTVQLRCPGTPLKVECSAAATLYASCYPEDDGKVSDDAGTVVVGTALSAGAGAASIIEMVPNTGTGAVPTGDSLAVSDLDGKGGLPIIYGGTITFTSGAGLTQLVATVTRKVRLINYWLIARDTTAANIKLTDGTNDITVNLAKGTTDNAIVAGSTMIAARDELAAAGTLNAVSTAACVCDVWVMAVPIA